MQYNAPHHNSYMHVHAVDPSIHYAIEICIRNRTLRLCAACGLAEVVAADFKRFVLLARDHVHGENPADVLIA